MQPLYNREGRAIAYIADNETSVYLYDGGPAAWVYQGCVYGYDGRFLGWMMYGWICDPQGHPAFFTDRSQGGPKRPVKQPRPIRGSREFRPQRALRRSRPSRPGMKTSWSAMSDESFFARKSGDPSPEADADAAAMAEGDPLGEGNGPPADAASAGTGEEDAAEDGVTEAESETIAQDALDRRED